MLNRKYRICLSAQLGNRDGTLYIDADSETENGYFEVMNHKNPIADLVVSDGSISFEGVIESLVGKTKYTAAGTVCGKMILLNLKTVSDIYSVSGEEISSDEENL